MNKRKFNEKVSNVVQGIMAKNEIDDIEAFITSADKKIVKKIRENFIASINVGPISYEFWKSGSKVQMVKNVLPGFKTSEKNEIKILTKEEAAQEILNIKLTSIFSKKKR